MFVFLVVLFGRVFVFLLVVLVIISFVCFQVWCANSRFWFVGVLLAL